MEDSTNSFHGRSVADSANLSKRARSIMAKFPDSFASSSMERSKDPEQMQDDYSVAKTGLQSPPPDDSMLRCLKQGPMHPMGPLKDHISHQQRHQIGGIVHIQPRRPSACDRQQHPLQQETCQGQVSSSQLHHRCSERQVSRKHASAEMGSAEGCASSPPAANTRLRRAKRRTNLPVGTKTDCIGCQELDQITPNNSQPQLLSFSCSQPHQTQQLAWEGQATSGIPWPSRPCVSIDMSSVDSCARKRGRKSGRGPTRCLDMWNMKDKIVIPTNEFGQPIGPNAPKLTNFLGTIARNGSLAPLNFVHWRALPEEKKEQVWELVKAKFDIDPLSRSWVLKSTGSKWKNWKCALKASHYSSHETDEERLADVDERVLPDQWRFLVSFWNSKEAKERSIKNRAISTRPRLCHTTGRKSFAQVREEEREKRPYGKEPSRADLFILTRTRKDGQPVNEKSSVVISKLRERAAQQEGTPQGSTIEDDVFFDVMGPDENGRVRTYGLGPAPSDLAGPNLSHAEALRMLSEANTEVSEMKQKIVALEQTCAQMAAQMTTMLSMMSTMHANVPDNHLSNAAASPSEPPRAELAADVSVASEGSQPQRGSITKRGKKASTRTRKVARRRR